MPIQGTNRKLPVVRGMGMYALPDRATGAAIGCSTGADVYGSWVQITVGEPYDILIHGIQIGPVATPSTSELYWQLQLGTGPAGGEIVISTFKLEAVETTSAVAKPPRNAPWLPFPLYVPAWTRIAGRAAHNVTLSSHIRNISLNVCRVQDEWVHP